MLDPVWFTYCLSVRKLATHSTGKFCTQHVMMHKLGENLAHCLKFIFVTKANSWEPGSLWEQIR